MKFTRTSMTSGRTSTQVSSSLLPRWWLPHRREEFDFCRGERVHEFDENSRKACERREDQISASIGPRKCWSPWESLRDHNTSHKNSRIPASRLKGTCPSPSEGAVNWRRERPEGKEKFLVYDGWMGVLSDQTYRIGGGLVEWELVCRGFKEVGALLVIIWSLSTTPAPHSPTPEGSCPCCVYHRPPMDSFKSDRNRRQACALPLPRIYLRLTLLTPSQRVSQKN